jgi:hypothetical protein
MEDMPTHELERLLSGFETQSLTHLQAYKEYSNSEDRQIIAERIMILEEQMTLIKSLLEERVACGKN